MSLSRIRNRTPPSRYSQLIGDEEIRKKNGCIACCSKEQDLQSVCKDDISISLRHSSDHRRSNPLSVNVDEPMCGIGGTRAAIRNLNNHKRCRPNGDDEYSIVSAFDGNVQKRFKRLKTDLYNETARKGEVLAKNYLIESPQAMKDAERIQPILLTVCGLPCPKFSRLGLREGLTNMDTARVFNAFFKRLGITRSRLIVIEEVDSLLHSDHQSSLKWMFRKLKLLGYHYRYKILDSSKHGAAQKRLRAFIVCALDAAVISAFTWPNRSRKGRIATLSESLLPEGEATKELFLRCDTRVAKLLKDPLSGLKRPMQGKVYSRTASVYNGSIHVLTKGRSCTATITASRSSGLYLWQRDKLRQLSGKEALNLFSYPLDEVEAYASGAKKLHINSLQLAELVGDSFPVSLVTRVIRALVDSFSSTASEIEKEHWMAR